MRVAGEEVGSLVAFVIGSPLRISVRAHGLWLKSTFSSRAFQRLYPSSPVSTALHPTSTSWKIELLPGSDDVTCR